MLSGLLGKKLKDDEIIEVLEIYGFVDVVYSFDRHQENTEDEYYASAKEAGFELHFDQDQVLTTIFCYMVAKDGFVPISPDLIGAPVYKTFDEAEQACKSRGVAYSTSDSTKGKKPHPSWLHVKSTPHWSHYQFDDGALSLVTLSLPKS